MSSTVYFYDPLKTVQEHIDHGPYVENLQFKKNVKQGQFSFLDKQVNSLFGVPACILALNSKWVEVLSKLEFDIITYKTVRSGEWPPNNYPNWMYVDSPEQLSLQDLDKELLGSLKPFPNQKISTANSFGVPSFKPEIWQEDFEKAKAILKPGQLLILSIMTSPVEGITQVEDAKILGEYAAQTSAEVIEINFACPNTGKHGLIYEDVELSVEICNKLKEVLGNRKLLAKVGYYKNKEALKQFLQNSKGVIDGISSTNTIGMKIIDNDGNPAFKDRETAGVSGWAIHNLAKEQLQTIMQFKEELSLSSLAVVGMGGISNPEDIKEYLDLDVSAVQAAAALWQNPYLAYQFKEKFL